jgi:hypothetical protein
VYAVTDDYVEVMTARSRQVRYRLEVIDGRSGHPIAWSDVIGATPRLRFLSGEVTNDATAAVRLQQKFTLADVDGSLIPTVGDDMLAPTSGNEFRLWAGPVLADGKVDLKPMGICGVSDFEATSSPKDGLVISCAGFDRSREVKRSKLTKPYTIRKGHNVVDEFMALILNRRPGTEFRAVTTEHNTTWQTLQENTDPWQAGLDLLLSAGLEAFFDFDGFCVVQPVPDLLNADPVWSYSEGVETTLLEVTNSSSNENVPNGVILTGESTSGISPVRVEVWDTDPNSPTYSGYDPGTGGFELTPYGVVPEFVNDNKVLTKAQGTAAATARLRKYKGGTRTAEFKAVPNYAHESDDVVWVRRKILGVDQAFIFERFTIQLGAKGEMNVRCRERQL